MLQKQNQQESSQSLLTLQNDHNFFLSPIQLLLDWHHFTKAHTLRTPTLQTMFKNKGFDSEVVITSEHHLAPLASHNTTCLK